MSLAGQLKVLAPMLDVQPDDIELYRHLLSKHEDGDYETMDVLLHELGQYDPLSAFFTFPANTGSREEPALLKSVLDKIARLCEKEGSPVNIKVATVNRVTRLTINNKKFEPGTISLVYNWHVQREELCKPPAFMTAAAEALNEYLPNGRFYLGYAEDMEDRYHKDYIYLVVYVRNGGEAILKKMKGVEWQPLSGSAGRGADAGGVSTGKVKSVRYEISGDQTVLKWRGSAFLVWFATLLVVSIPVIDSLARVDFLRRFLDLSERHLPHEYFLYSVGLAAVVLVMFLLNRPTKLTLTREWLTLSKGFFPLFPGFRRKQYAMDRVLKVFLTTVSISGAGTDEGSFADGPSWMYVVKATVYPTRKIRLTNLMDKEEAKFIEQQVNRFIVKPKKAGSES